MKLSSVGYKEIGKVLINLGQGITLAGVVSTFFTDKNVTIYWLSLLGGLFAGILLFIFGIIFIEKSELHKKG